MSDDWQVVQRQIDRSLGPHEAEAALARLREREALLENQLQINTNAWQAKSDLAEAAEARVAELQAYYDEHTNVGEISPVQKVVQLQARVAELIHERNWHDERAARLEEALREIDNYGTHFTPQTAIARRALAHEEEA